MPDPRRAPPIAWAAGVDAREWSGVDLFQRGENDPVAMPTFASSGSGVGAGIYLDPVHLINGYGVAVELDASIRDFDCYLSLTADDRIAITNANGGGGKLTLFGLAVNEWWGLPTSGNVEIADGETYVAPRDWRRGLVWPGATAPPRLFFAFEGEIGALRVPATSMIVQSVVTGLRVRGEVGDLDDTTSCIEARDNAVNAFALPTYRWFATDDGRIGWSGTAAGADAGLTWLSESFRDRLGFTGDEVVENDAPAGGGIVAGTMYWSIASRPCPGLLVPSRPLRRQTPIQTEQSSALLLTDGSYASAHVATHLGYEAEWSLDGPDGAAGDLHHHWLDLRARYARTGEPLTLCQSWGDPRRRLLPTEVTASTPAYSLTHTTDRGGYRGRLLGRLHPDSGREERVDWRDAIRIASTMQTRISVREPGV